MTLNRILGIPIIEQASGDFVARQEQERYAQIQAAIDALRCPSCGSLNHETTLFVFKTGVEKMTECRDCGAVCDGVLHRDSEGLLAFLPDLFTPTRRVGNINETYSQAQIDHHVAGGAINRRRAPAASRGRRRYGAGSVQ